MKPKYANFTVTNTNNKNFIIEIDMRVYYDSKSVTVNPIHGTIGWNRDGGFKINEMSLDDLDLLLDTLEEARSIAVRELYQ